MLPFRFYLITDGQAACREAPGVPTALAELAAEGLRALQVREKALSPKALHLHCRAVLAVLEAGGGKPAGIYLNDRADLALSLGLRGVHLREDSLPLQAQGEPMRQALCFGVSAHSVEGVLAAQEAGAEFATFGPVYDTPSKAAYGAPVGLESLRQAARNSRLPLLALGGVTPERVEACLDAGAHGVAAISAVWDAPEPRRALAAFGEALGGL